MIRRTLACALILTLSWTGWAWAAGPAFAQSTPRQVSQEEVLAEFDDFMDPIEELRSHIDRSQFELGALLDKLDYDADDIIKFVREEIDFEQYPGLLRGAQGTLMSRAGNALDQAVLLATLLKDAGTEARIVEGRLLEQARNPLSPIQARSRSSTPGSFLSTEEELTVVTKNLLRPSGAREELLERIVGESALASQRNMSALIQEVSNTSAMLMAGIEAAGGSIKTSSVAGLSQSSSEEYFWVDYRRGPSSPWSEAHPVFRDPPEPKVSRIAVFSDEIPERLQHRVRIELLLERDWGNKLETLPLFTAWERPSANLHGKSVSLAIVPGGFGKVDELQTPSEVLEASDWWMPVIDGIVPADASVFSLEGVVGPQETLTAAGALIANVSGKLNSGVGALGRIGSADSKPKSPTAIRKISVKYSLISPEGTAEVTERVLFERRRDQMAINGVVINHDGWKREMAAGLTQNQYVGVNCGRIPRTAILDQTLQEFEEGLDAFMSSIPVDADDGSRIHQGLANRLSPLSNSSLLRALHIFDLGPETLNIELAYRPSPMIIVLKQGLIGSTDGNFYGFEQVDVVSSSWLAFSRNQGQLLLDAEKVLKLGVWTTATEGAALTKRQSAQESGGAFALLNSSQVLANKLVVLKAADEERVKSSGLDWASQQPLLDELERGRIVAIPTNMLADTETSPTSWWSIDPETGETVGMVAGPGGVGGSQFVKYLTLFLVFVATALLYVSYYDCWQQYSGTELWCCLFDSWFTAILGALLALLVAELLLMAATAMEAAALLTGPLSGSEWAALVAAILTDLPAGATGLAGARIPLCATATGP